MIGISIPLNASLSLNSPLTVARGGLFARPAESQSTIADRELAATGLPYIRYDPTFLLFRLGLALFLCDRSS